MDLSVLTLSDIDSVMKRAEVEALKENHDPKRVLIRIYFGADHATQVAPLTAATHRIISLFESRGIEIKVQTFTNNEVKNDLKWSVNELIDCLLAADIHIVSSHIHQGNLTKTALWNITNISSQFERLKYHLGFPMGNSVLCPVLWGDHFTVFDALGDLCPPSIQISLMHEEMPAEELIALQR